MTKTSTRINPNPGIKHQKSSRRFPKGGWVVRYRDSANATLRKTFPTQREAKDFQASVRTDKNRGDFINARQAETPFGQVAEKWFASLQVRPKTESGYRSILDWHLLPAFSLRPIGRINTAEIQEFLKSSGKSPGTQRNILRVMNPVMKHAIMSNLIRANPCSMVKLPTIHRQEMHKLDAKQVRELADEISPQYRTLVLMAAYTGLRTGELLALRVKRLDLKTGRVEVAESLSDIRGELTFGPPKNGRMRTVPLVPSLVALLKEQTAGKGPDDLVFTGPTGNALRHGNYYGRHYKQAIMRLTTSQDGASPRWPKDLGGLRFHDLRHTCASLLIAQNMHPKAVSDWLGHSSISITMDRYGHLYKDHAQPTINKLEEAYKGASV